ncbi:MAG TPA: NAD-dependent epimerase/dehydratase family protein [Acidobacteriaceae bacterium]|nr:NAD-dependent epimerase/dehydratase family protein [Acidobacteriaceae bacterium]
MKVIITGATGMVGEGVLFECLEHPAVDEVLLVSRRPYGTSLPKVKECIVPDFMQLEAMADQLRGYDACFFCAGVTSVGKSEADYTRITCDTTLHFAETLVKLNPAMVFTYVSGMGTDSTEKGRLMWARVKGRTENALTRMGFKAEYNFRPGFMKAMPGQRNLKGSYKAFAWLYPVLRVVAPNSVSTLEDVGRAMIRCVTQGYPKTVLEVRDINALGKA